MNIFEKYVNSKVYEVIDKFLKLTIINLLFIITFIAGLGIFSFMPALVSMVFLIKSLSCGHGFNFIKVFYKIFFKIYLKSQKVFIIYFILFFVISYNCFYFYEGITQVGGLFYVGSFMAMLVVLICIIISFIHSIFLIITYKELTTIRLIKNAFIFVPGFFFTNAIILVLTIVTTIVSIYFPPLPFICGFSLLFFIFSLLLSKKYNKIPMGEFTSMDILDYE